MARSTPTMRYVFFSSIAANASANASHISYSMESMQTWLSENPTLTGEVWALPENRQGGFLCFTVAPVSHDIGSAAPSGDCQSVG